MQRVLPFLSITLLAATAACSSTTAEPSTSSVTDAGVEAGASGSGCAFGLVQLRTSRDTSCSGGNTHAWPVGMGPTDCHGWRAVDTSGKPHDNSANDIKCNSDGSFSFVQFAGGLDCSGTGVLKTYRLDACAQDIPPTLHTVAFDLTCCSDPTSPACKRGVPSVTVPGASIFLNNAPCTP